MERLRILLLMDYEKEIRRVQWTAIAIVATLVAIMWLASLVFPPNHNGKPLPGGEQFPVMDPGH